MINKNNSNNEYIAHTREDGLTQSMIDHSLVVASLSQSFAIEELKPLAYEIGLKHDIGKYQESFQKRIRGENVFQPHALCGAQYWRDAYRNTLFSVIAQYITSGHHTGLQDYGAKQSSVEGDGTLCGTLNNAQHEDYSQWKAELERFSLFENNFDEISKTNDALRAMIPANELQQIKERIAFITRYLFSCVVDADWLDTENFVDGTTREPIKANFQSCLEDVNATLARFSPKTELQKARSRIQKQIFDKVNEKGNLFLINMPVGSGKTLASVKFALERAIAQKKKRIIYVIPYTSIIDQTADEFEKIFGEDADLLLHYSANCADESKIDEEHIRQLRQASENWDADFIITTAIQFFESLYSNKQSKLRKLHNLADSIIVLDEVHTFPREYLQPCLQGLGYVVELLHSEAIFLTATMPDYKRLYSELTDADIRINDLVTDRSDFKYFKKCNYENIGEISDECLVSNCIENPSSLIVVNSRAAAREIYSLLKASPVGKCYHLSTYMIAKDRKKIIREIKRELAIQKEKYGNQKDIPIEERIVLVSTSLIEAGVDIDFSAAYRELGSLDNILQTGGRCDREGFWNNAIVGIFTRIKKKDTSENVNITKALIKNFADISSNECIEEYYNRVFSYWKKELERNTLTKYAKSKAIYDIPFRTYAENFKLISNDSISLIVPRDEKGKALVSSLKETGKTNWRELQAYTLTIYRNELNELIKQYAVKDYGGAYVLEALHYYEEDIGITFESKDFYFD